MEHAATWWWSGCVAAEPGGAVGPVALVLLAAATLGAQQRLADVVPLLPKAEPWLAECQAAFAFGHAPQREAVAWFTARKREDRGADQLGDYVLNFRDRADGEVRSVDLGTDLRAEDWWHGPVWTRDAAHIAVAVAWRRDGNSGTRVVVVDVKSATATTWLDDVFGCSLSWTADGRTLAIGGGGKVRALTGLAEEAWTREFPTEPGWGCAAAISPDGKQVLAVSSKGVFMLTPEADRIERLGDVQLDATIFTAPQWSPEGSKAVAVVGGAVTLIDVAKKTVRAVGEARLGGRAQAVVWAPGASHVLAAVQQVRDGSALEVLLGAGHARQRYFMLPVLVSGTGDEVLPLPKLRSRTPDPGGTPWIYRPQLTEALSRWRW